MILGYTTVHFLEIAAWLTACGVFFGLLYVFIVTEGFSTVGQERQRRWDIARSYAYASLANREVHDDELEFLQREFAD